MKSYFKSSITLNFLTDTTLTGAIRKTASVCARRKTVLIALLFLVSLVILVLENLAKHKEEDGGYLTKSINYADNVFTG